MGIPVQDICRHRSDLVVLAARKGSLPCVRSGVRSFISYACSFLLYEVDVAWPPRSEALPTPMLGTRVPLPMPGVELPTPGVELPTPGVELPRPGVELPRPGAVIFEEEFPIPGPVVFDIFPAPNQLLFLVALSEELPPENGFHHDHEPPPELFVAGAAGAGAAGVAGSGAAAGAGAGFAESVELLDPNQLRLLALAGAFVPLPNHQVLPLVLGAGAGEGAA